MNRKYLYALSIKQNMKCALTGLKLTFPRNKKEMTQCNASLDRIDSSKGYIEGNVQWVTKEVNQSKMDSSQKGFIKMCHDVSEKHKYSEQNAHLWT